MRRLTIVLCVALVGSAFLATATDISAGAIIGVAVSQQAETFTHKEAGVQFQLPKGWKAKPDGEVITVSSADDAFQVVFWVPDEDTLRPQ